MLQATEMSWEQALEDQEALDPVLDTGLPTQKEQQGPRLPQWHPVARTHPLALPIPDREVSDRQALPG